MINVANMGGILLNVIGDKMKQRRKELKMSGAVLAEKLGVIRNTISRWERGERTPSMEKLSAIAAVLDTTVAYLIDEKTNIEEKKELSAAYNIIVIAVYEMQEIASYNINTLGTIGIEREVLVPEHILGTIDNKRPPFAIVMPNDSMKGANMNEKDSVIINPAEHVNSGDPALIIYNGTPMLRWVCYKSNGNIELQPANPNHRTVVVEKQHTEDPSVFTIIGRAVVAMAQKDLKSAF